LSRIQREYNTRGVQVIEVAFEEQANLLSEFIMRFKPGFPIAWAKRNDIFAYAQHSMMVRFMVPKMVFIDRGGTIQAQYSGEEPFFADEEKSIRAKLDSLIKAPVSAKKK
jgi:hypothetical protein